MLSIVSVNLNGIRSAAKKGFFNWLMHESADIVCIQETKAWASQLTDEAFHPAGYYCNFVDAEKKGYSGVAIYSKLKPNKIMTTLGWPCCDKEGRYLQYDYTNFSVVSLYLPSGTSGEHRQQEKYNFMDHYLKKLKQIVDLKKSVIICGDWNIAHKKIDIKNWQSNQKNSGFLPEERAWLDLLFDKIGYVDAFRVINHEPGQYTWWSNRGQAWAKNVGWRIDYQIITPDLKDKVLSAKIYRDEKFSDHAPLIIQYDI